MTLENYESRFFEDLIDNWSGTNWGEYVKSCYAEYIKSIDEEKIAAWEMVKQ